VQRRCRAEIANTKRQAIRNEEERKKLVVDKQKYIDALEERRQAFALFEEKRKGAEAAIKRLAVVLSYSVQSEAIRLIVDNSSAFAEFETKRRS
jgi:hypothetical protein